MIWKVDTVKKGGGHRVVAIRHTGKKGPPDGILEFPHRPDVGDLIDGESLVCAVVENPFHDPDAPVGTDNRTHIIVEDREPETSERKENKRLATFLSPANFKLLADAVIAMKNGDPSKVEELESLINLEVENKEIPDGPKGDAV